MAEGKELEKRVETLEKTLTKLQGTVGELRSTIFTRDQEQFLRNFEQIENVRDKQSDLSAEIHSLLSAYSLGLDIGSVPLPRFIPVRSYLSNGSDEKIADVSNAVQRLLATFGFDISDKFPPQRGSWFQKFFAKTKETITQPEVQERLVKLERALEMKALGLPQAEITKMEAEAAAALIASLKDVSNAEIQCGSVLLIKTTNHLSQASMQVRLLTQREMMALERNQRLLNSPEKVLEELSKLDVESLQFPAESVVQTAKLQDPRDVVPALTRKGNEHQPK